MRTQLWACVTTMDRTRALDTCLASLWSSSVTPHGVVVSDDSPDSETRRRNREVVACYPATTYLVGPRAGVCANRNRAVNAVPSADDIIVAFVDDDLCVGPDFIERGLGRYASMTKGERDRTILAGVSRSVDGRQSMAGRLSFHGHFRPSAVPETVVIHAAMFPRHLFEQDPWDENIFLGYEDAELCLRALGRGYRILRCAEMNVLDRGSDDSVFEVPAVGRLTEYDLCIEAARLYVGVKRYRHLSPSRSRLLAFIALYGLHMTVFLLRRRALRAWPEILRQSRVARLWPMPAAARPIAPGTRP